MRTIPFTSLFQTNETLFSDSCNWISDSCNWTSDSCNWILVLCNIISDKWNLISANEIEFQNHYLPITFQRQNWMCLFWTYFIRTLLVSDIYTRKLIYFFANENNYLLLRLLASISNTYCNWRIILKEILLLLKNKDLCIFSLI